MTSTNAKNNSFYEFRNSTEAKDEVDIYIYGDIENYAWCDGDVSAFSFAKQLNECGDVNKINVRINSVGGSVFQAVAIRNTLVNHSAEVIVYVEGLAASAATLIATAGSKVYMCPGAMYMIHNPRIYGVGGEAKDLKHKTDLLENLKNSMVKIYKDKTGLEENKIIEFMNEEAWFNCEDAVVYGFADEISGEEVTAMINNNTLHINGVNFNNETIVAKLASNQEFKNKLKKPSVNVIQNTEGFFIQNYKEEKKVDTPKQNIINSVEELKNVYPSFVNEIINAATKIERERIKSIEDIENGIPDKELVKKAKFTNVMEARDLAFISMQSDTQKAINYLNNVEQDNLQSGSNDVKAIGNTGNTLDENNNDDSIINMVAKAINERGEDNAN